VRLDGKTINAADGPVPSNLDIVKVSDTGAGNSADYLTARLAAWKADEPLPTDDQTVRPRNPNGRRGSESVCITNRFDGGTVDYTLRRLARDEPELLESIKRGELSVNQAAIRAGIRKKPTPLPHWRRGRWQERNLAKWAGKPVPEEEIKRVTM
jgi:hypothetical protein